MKHETNFGAKMRGVKKRLSAFIPFASLLTFFSRFSLLIAFGEGFAVLNS